MDAYWCLKRWTPKHLDGDLRSSWVLQVGSLDADSCHEWLPVPRWFIPLFIGFPPFKVVHDFFHPQYVPLFLEVGWRWKRTSYSEKSDASIVKCHHHSYLWTVRCRPSDNVTQPWGHYHLYHMYLPTKHCHDLWQRQIARWYKLYPSNLSHQKFRHYTISVYIYIYICGIVWCII